jgi:hypothetical protein
MQGLRLKGEYSVVQSTKNTDQLDENENLPTEIVESLLELRGKLNVMNEFYEKKVKD